MTALERARQRWGQAMLVSQTGPTVADDNAQLLALQAALQSGNIAHGFSFWSGEGNGVTLVNHSYPLPSRAWNDSPEGEPA